MKVYIHDNRKEPTLLVPVDDSKFLAWTKRDADVMSDWTLKHIKFIHAILEKFGKDVTPAEAFEKSEKCKEASPLEVLVYTGYSIEQVRDIYEQHRRVIEEEEGKSKT